MKRFRDPNAGGSYFMNDVISFERDQLERGYHRRGGTAQCDLVFRG